MGRRSGIACYVSAFALILSACTTASPGSTGAPSASAGGARAPTGTVTIASGTFGQEKFDPAVTTHSDVTYYGSVFDWFVGVNPKGQKDPAYGALESWSVSSDGKAWTLKLHPGIKFHDGVELTAEDGAFSMQRYAQPDAVCSPCGILKSTLESVKTTDKYTFVVNFKQPNYLFADSLSTGIGLPVLPKAYFTSVGSKGFSEKPIGSGPFTFVSRRQGQDATFEANTEYWSKSRIPSFKTLRLVLSPEPSTRLAQVATGEADLAAMTAASIADIKAKGLQLMGPKRAQTMFQTMYRAWDPAYAGNIQEVRKAINLAVDKAALTKAVYPEGTGEPAASLWSPLHVGYDPQLKTTPYDPKEARRLLESVGRVGQKVLLYQYQFPASPEIPLLQEIIASSLNQAGFDAKLQPEDYGTLRPKILEANNVKLAPADGPLVLLIITASAGVSIDQNLRQLLVSKQAGGSFALFWDPKSLDKMLTDYLSTPGEAERSALGVKMNQLVTNTYGVSPLALVDIVWAGSKRLGSWAPMSGTAFDPRYETITLKGN